MNSNLISIVVPVYNTGKYVSRCLESILNQTYKNIEIIIINDGSTDNSKEICCNYESKYKNITFIDKKNEGVSSARNIGILNSNGKYIMFVDSDDQLPIDAVETLFNSMNEENVDVVVGDYSKIDEHNNIKRLDFVRVNNERDFIQFVTDNYLWEPWGKLYKKEKIKKDFDNTIFVGEDVLFLVENFSNSTYKFISNIVYLYRENSESVMNQKYINNRNITQFFAFRKIIRLLDDKRKDFFIELYIINLLDMISKYKDPDEILIKQRKKIIQDFKNPFYEFIKNGKLSIIGKVKYILKYICINIKMR